MCQVLYRDPCSYCGEPAFTVDHIVPMRHDGRAEEGNLVGACPRCNVAKGDRPLLEFLLAENG